jgi:hypothetical protein
LSNNIDLTGKKFGRLAVVKRNMEFQNGDRALWECKCDCGEITYVSTYNLRKGLTQSCGCLRRETARRNIKLGGRHKQSNIA